MISSSIPPDYKEQPGFDVRSYNAGFIQATEASIQFLLSLIDHREVRRVEGAGRILAIAADSLRESLRIEVEAGIRLEGEGGQ